MNNEDIETISVEEAGRYLGVGKNFAYKLVKDGKIPVVRLGRRIRVPRSALAKMLQNAYKEELHAK